MSILSEFLQHLRTAPAVVVAVDRTQGSAPRAKGAWMAVFADSVWNTIGGGQLELQAIAQARSLLLQASVPVLQRYPLGPSLGQCCGGVVHLCFERVTAADIERLAVALAPIHHPLALFGGGHVGRALVHLFATLPLDVLWLDSRDEVFPKDLPENVRAEHSDPIEAAVAGLAPQSRVLIMSFSHAEDLQIVAACLQRQRARADLPFIGLLGSKTKWATFSHRLAERGFNSAELAQVHCPIGVPGIAGKEPEVIAIAVVAQLLQAL